MVAKRARCYGRRACVVVLQPALCPGALKLSVGRVHIIVSFQAFGQLYHASYHLRYFLLPPLLCLILKYLYL
jgi:hypothetical protein